MFFLPKRGGWVVSALGLHITPGLVVCFFCPELAFKLRCLGKLPVCSLNPNHRQGAARILKAKRAYEFAAAVFRGAGSQRSEGARHVAAVGAGRCGPG